MGLAYPTFGKKIRFFLEELHRKAESNIYAIRNVESLNGLFGPQFYSSRMNDGNINAMHLWPKITLNNCGIVKLPDSVKSLLVLGEHFQLSRIIFTTCLSTRDIAASAGHEST